MISSCAIFCFIYCLTVTSLIDFNLELHKKHKSPSKAERSIPSARSVRDKKLRRRKGTDKVAPMMSVTSTKLKKKTKTVRRKDKVRHKKSEGWLLQYVKVLCIKTVHDE